MENTIFEHIVSGEHTRAKQKLLKLFINKNYLPNVDILIKLFNVESVYFDNTLLKSKNVMNFITKNIENIVSKDGAFQLINKFMKFGFIKPTEKLISLSKEKSVSDILSKYKNIDLNKRDNYVYLNMIIELGGKPYKTLCKKIFSYITLNECLDILKNDPIKYNLVKSSYDYVTPLTPHFKMNSDVIDIKKNEEYVKNMNNYTLYVSILNLHDSDDGETFILA